MTGINLNDRRIWLGGGVVVAVLIAAIGWLFIIHPKLSSASDLRSQAASTAQQNDALANKVADLRRQNAHLGDLQGKLSSALDAVPARADLTDFSRGVTSIANAESVDIQSITFADATPLSSPAPTTPTDGTDPSDSTSSSGTESATPTAAPTTSAAPTQLSYAVTITAAGSAAHLTNFLAKLHQGRRAALVSSVQMTSGASDQPILTVQLNIFSAPMSTAQVQQLKRLFAPTSS